MSMVRSQGPGAKSVTALTGHAAREARILGQNVLELVIALQEEIKANVSSEIKETLKVFESMSLTAVCLCEMLEFGKLSQLLWRTVVQL